MLNFTANDAQTIVTLIQKRLPLQNLDEASAIGDLLNRFSQWANAQFDQQNAKVPGPKPPEPPPKNEPSKRRETFSGAGGEP